MCTCFFHAGFFFIIRIDFNMIGHVPCEISKKKEKKAEKQTKTNMLENVFVYVSFGTAHLLILINILVRKYQKIQTNIERILFVSLFDAFQFGFCSSVVCSAIIHSRKSRHMMYNISFSVKKCQWVENGIV